MATHSGILAWKIPWTEEPGRLQSMGSQRVGHDSALSTAKIRLTNLALDLRLGWFRCEANYFHLSASCVSFLIISKLKQERVLFIEFLNFRPQPL